VTPEEVAVRFDHRPGYRLADYGPVGIPVFKVTVIALVLVKKDLDPLEEFVLRVVERGLAQTQSIQGILGLTARVVDSTITRLVQKEYVSVLPGASPETLDLTPRGTAVAAEQREIRPLEQSLPFTYDGFLRKPAWYDQAQLLAPKDLRDLNVPELRGSPDRGPEIEELDTRDVAEVVTLAFEKRDAPFTLLRILTVERRVRLYKEAVALAYRSEDGKNIQIGFALDGRLSESHELAFAEQKGIERHPLFMSLKRSDHLDITEVLGSDLARKASNPEVVSGQAEVAKARRALVEARVQATKHGNDGEQSRSAAVIKQAEQALLTAQANPVLQEVRQVHVYEHAEILEDALQNAQERLLVVSPWIRANVVNNAFIEKIERLLKRGVSVVIGHGLGVEGQDERPQDRKARERLEALSDEYTGCLVKHLGDTHAKLLIKDHEYCVVTSFNWLSFRGDKTKTFREELGLVVRIRERVDELFEEMLTRIRKSI